MIRVVNESSNYTDFSMLEDGDIFYWDRYSGYFMKVNVVGFLTSTITTPSVTQSNVRYNAVGLEDGYLYLVNEDDTVIAATSARLIVEM